MLSQLSLFSLCNFARSIFADDIEDEVAIKDDSTDLNATAVSEEPLLKVQEADLPNDHRSGAASSHGSSTPSHGSRTNSSHVVGGNMLTVTDTPDWAGGGNTPASGTSPTGKVQNTARNQSRTN